MHGIYGTHTVRLIAVSSMALSTLKIKALRAESKPYKASDGMGMYLHVMPTGARIWRMDYRYDGKRKSLTIGDFSIVPLAAARERRDAARKCLLDGINPEEAKASDKSIPDNALWHDLRKKSLAPKYAYDQWKRLERLILPHIGDIAITDLKPKHALSIFQVLEARGTVETAHRSIQLTGAGVPARSPQGAG
jgi:hypothetical protein